MMLLDAIEKKRKEMFFLAKRNGFHSNVTIKCSQELDDLLILFQKKQIKK